MNEISFSEDDKKCFKKALKYSKHWCNVHRWEIGAAEMALGAAILVWGLHSGQLEIGRDFIVSKLPNYKSGNFYGTAPEARVRGIGSSILGSIGVTTSGDRIGIPAIVLAGGGAFILNEFGYAIEDSSEEFFPTAANLGNFVAGASTLTLGLALAIDGARCVVKNERDLLLGSVVAYSTIYFNELKTKVIANSQVEFKAIIDEFARTPNTHRDIGERIIPGSGFRSPNMSSQLSY